MARILQRDPPEVAMVGRRMALQGVAGAAITWLGGDRPALDARRVDNDATVVLLARVHGIDADQQARITAIFRASDRIGTGNSDVTEHPMDVATCAERRAAAAMAPDPAFARICGGPYMAPLYDPATQTPDDATACIDQFEFPDVPCAYPIVWERPSEAEDLCEAMGKRLCDAHEWEGACEGDLQPPDYAFELAEGEPPAAGARAMRVAHNQQYANPATRTWSYGPEYETAICATGSAKTAGCEGDDWDGCGSNTYPAGAFPSCRSPLGVYDLNGNVSETMNLPLAPDQLASNGTVELGVTEMKGSWFVFDEYRPHADWCRWRAPFWHGSHVRATDGYRSYHLGFRCCKTLDE
jgi:hypothetical protein